MRWFRRRPKETSRVDAEWERQTVQIAAAAEHRRRSLVGQEHVVAELEALLFQHDPIGISFEDNSDEYRAEAETITLRRSDAQSVEDVRRIAHEEFVRWFDASTAGPEARYQRIAEDIWRVWTR